MRNCSSAITDSRVALETIITIKEKEIKPYFFRAENMRELPSP
jgi:hypothetical protein